jgi:hypothetical protein
MSPKRAYYPAACEESQINDFCVDNHPMSGNQSTRTTNAREFTARFTRFLGTVLLLTG